METCYSNQLPTKPLWGMRVNDADNFSELTNYLFYWISKVRIVGNDYRLIEIIIETID